MAVPGLFIGITWLGRPGAALAVLLNYLVSRTVYGMLLHRLIGLPTIDLFRAMRHGVLGCVLMAAIRLLFGAHWYLAFVLAVAAYTAVVLPLLLPMLKGARQRPSPSTSRTHERTISSSHIHQGATPCGSL